MKKKILLTFACLCAILMPATPAHALIIDFDDIPVLRPVAVFDGYKGFQWSNFYFINKDYAVPSGYYNGVVSGDNVGFNSNGSPADMFVTTGMFDFTGAYLTAAWRDGLQVKVDGYNGAAQLFTRTVSVDSDAPMWFDFNYTGIDKLLFTSFGGIEVPEFSGSGAHFAIDNLYINQQRETQAVIPEPSTMALILAGLPMAGFVRRRRLNG